VTNAISLEDLGAGREYADRAWPRAWGERRGRGSPGRQRPRGPGGSADCHTSPGCARRARRSCQASCGPDGGAHQHGVSYALATTVMPLTPHRASSDPRSRAWRRR